MAQRSITVRGRLGHTSIPNWRWEDPRLDSYDLHVVCWLLSHHADYREALSVRVIGARLGIAPGRVRKSLDRLEALRIVELTVGERGRIVVTIDAETWETDRPPAAADAPSTAHVVRGEEPSTAHVVRGDRARGARSGDSDLIWGEEQLVTPPTPPSGGTVALFEPVGIKPIAVTAEDTFGAFWAMYPKRADKPAALRAWRRAVKAATVVEILTGLDVWVGYWRARHEPQFVPHPATWLNGQRWHDAPPPLPRPAAGGLTPMQRAYQRRTGCSDDEARAWQQSARRDGQPPVVQ